MTLRRITTRDPERALDVLWPAPLTAILRLREPIAASAGLVKACACPTSRGCANFSSREALVSTSVNLSGERAVYSTEQTPMELLEKVDALLDAGALASSASTLVDFTSELPAWCAKANFSLHRICGKRCGNRHEKREKPCNSAP
jgi:tRNA A37 threonylcarbamoyladenosine synthetase subunit TsaC/SUA5/YrdC